MNTTWSRREFLELSGAAVGASLGTPSLRAGRVPPSNTVRFGMVGVGMQGSGLLGEAIKLPGVACAGAADLYDGRHTLAREIAGATLPVTRRYQQLLDDKTIDCIVAAVPDHWHRRIVVDAVSAGKDIYCEKPMSHTAADGVAMVDAVKPTNRIVQIGSQRVSSQICAKARELIAQGAIGELMMVEGSLGRNDPTGAWEYPPPPDLSARTLDWDTWQGDVPKRAFDPNIFARWRCWKEYGTGVAGALLVHLISGLLFMLSINEPPRQALEVGGIRRWKDGRNMPDVQLTNFYYGDLPVSMRLNLGTELPETYRFHGAKGVLELAGSQLTVSPQSGRDRSRVTTRPAIPAHCGKPTRSNGTGRTTQNWVSACRSPKPPRSPHPILTVPGCICGISSRPCGPGSRWSRTWCSAIMRRWPATWRTRRTSGGPR